MVFMLILFLLKETIDTLYRNCSSNRSACKFKSCRPVRRSKRDLSLEIEPGDPGRTVSNDLHQYRNHSSNIQTMGKIHQISKGATASHSEDDAEEANSLSKKSKQSVSISCYCKTSKAYTSEGLRSFRTAKGFRPSKITRFWCWTLSVWILMLEAECILLLHSEDLPSQDLQRVSKDKRLHSVSEEPKNGPYCGSMRIANDIANLEKLKGCKVIEGDLQIVLIGSTEDITAKWGNWSFPELVQITGFLLVYRVYGLRSLGQLFPNLAVIRGMNLHQSYSLVIYYVWDLEIIGLYHLTSILEGSVRIQNNYNLCHIDTVDWFLINKKGFTENVFKKNNEDMCGPCQNSSQCPHGRCWSSAHCQRICKPECGRAGCSSRGECCHSLCLGGCSQPNDPSSCFACQDVYYNNQICMKDCPKDHYKYLGYRCVSEKECHDTGGHFIYGEECVQECPVGYHEDKAQHLDGTLLSSCTKCDDPCNRTCPSQFINSIEKARMLNGCTVINTSLIISITGGKHIAKELTKSLSLIQEVTDYVRVFSSNALLSLEFLSSLKTIGGNKLYDNKYALYVHGNDNLEMIWDWDKHGSLTITKKNAEVLFHSNPHLCYERIEELLDKIDRRSEDSNLTMRLTNGNKVACRIMEQNVLLQALNRRGVIKISWRTAFMSDDDRKLTGYYVYYKPSKTDSTYLAGRDACDDDWAKKYVEIKDKDDWNVTYLKGLMPATRYAVYVETETVVDADSGARSTISYATTMPYNPSSPRNLKLDKTSEDSITISWTAPIHANGEIHHYFVTVSPYPYHTDKDVCSDIPSPNTIPEVMSPDKDVTSSTEIPPVDQDNEIASLDNGFGECCSCTSNKSRAQKRQQDINFEDKLFNFVYKTSNHRWKRDARDNNGNSDLDDSDIIEEPIPTVSDYIEPDKIKFTEYNEKFPWERMALTKNKSLTISGLNHFTRYLIKVVACHQPQPHSITRDGYNYQSINNQTVLCSLKPATNTAITSIKSGANQVNNVRVVNGDQFGIKIVSWDPPHQPNGELLAYIITMQPQSAKGALQQLCVSVQAFEERNNTYEMLVRDFEPGLYSLSIKTYTNPFIDTNESYGNIIHDIRVEGIEVPPLDISIWVVVCIFLLLLMVGVVAILLKVLARKPDGFITENPRYDTTGQPTWSLRIQSMFASEHILQMQDLILDDGSELGKGHFGVVRQGKLTRNATTIPIAAKVVTDHQAKDDILHEAKLMLKLKCYHLVKAYGIVATPTEVYLVMEFMAHGDLLQYLRSLKLLDNDIFSVLTLDQVCAMGVQIADGMAYMASYKIVHRDLAARNCLMDDQLHIKISDFGMSRLTGNDYYQISKTKYFPVRWLPPEYLIHSRFTSQSDVWSYGVVLWEILSGGARPYQNFDEKMVWEQVKCGHTLASQLPIGTPKFLCNIVTNCWKFHGHMRPYFPQIIASLFPHTSPCFTQHFGTYSFYHSKAGQDYKSRIERLQDGEDESDLTMPVTTPSSPLNGSDNGSQPSFLPSKPFLGLKWRTSLSFRVRTAPRSTKGSTEGPASCNPPDFDLCNPSGPEKGAVHVVEEQELSSSDNTSVNKKPEFTAKSLSRLTDTEISSDFMNTNTEKETQLNLDSSNSEDSLCPENQIMQDHGANKTCEDTASNVFAHINNHGMPSSSLSSPRTMPKSSFDKLSKPFKILRSASSPNIEPTAC